MKYVKRSVPLLIMALLLPGIAVSVTNTNGASASQCETQSPQWVQLGDSYYDLDGNKNISAKVARNLEQFYQRLEGRWIGEQISNDCLGKGDSRRLRISELVLENVRAEPAANGHLILRADKELIRIHSDGGREVAKTIRPNQRTDFYPASDLMHLEFLSRNSVSMIKRYRQNINSVYRLSSGHHLPTGSLLVERVDELTLAAKKLTIQTTWYHNGYFSGTETIHLKRR